MTRDDGSRPGCAAGTWLARRERRDGVLDQMAALDPVTVYIQQRPPEPGFTGWHVQEAFEEGLRRGRAGR